jgi:DNA repair protein RecO (recombination protein O)
MSDNLRNDLQPAFILHRRAFRETSAIVEVFTRNHGRIGVVARGACRPRSALRAALMPFAPLLMSWSGRGELATLRSVELANVPSDLFGKALLSGMYVNELVMRLTHRHDPHPELFEAYEQAITELGTGACLEQTLRMFEKRVLEAIGYGLILESEADNDKAICAGEQYRYIADRGPTQDPHLAGESVDVCGETLLTLSLERPLSTLGQREAKRLMRFLLAVHLGGRPLASRELFR